MNKPVITGNTITVPASLEYLVDVDSFVEGKLTAHGVSASVLADIAISVSELVNNAILHGNKADRNKTVTVSVELADNRATIAVSDQGSGFDPNCLPDPIAEENLLKEVGRGIFIVESLMDEVDVKTSPDGTTVTITKKLN